MRFRNGEGSAEPSRQIALSCDPGYPHHASALLLVLGGGAPEQAEQFDSLQVATDYSHDDSPTLSAKKALDKLTPCLLRRVWGPPLAYLTT